MLARTAIGFAVLFGLLGLGALVRRLRQSGRPLLRTIGARVHWAVGVVAAGCIALLVVAAIQALAG